MLLEALATICAGLFAGASIYVSFVEHPARLQCGTELAATEFGPSYRRATIMQASLAAVGLAAGLLCWVRGRSFAVLIGSLLLGLVIPFTLLIIMPTNKLLLDPNLDRGSPEAATLLERWGWLHAVRSVLSGVAFGFLVWQLAGPPWRGKDSKPGRHLTSACSRHARPGGSPMNAAVRCGSKERRIVQGKRVACS